MQIFHPDETSHGMMPSMGAFEKWGLTVFRFYHYFAICIVRSSIELYIEMKILMKDSTSPEQLFHHLKDSST